MNKKHVAWMEESHTEVRFHMKFDNLRSANKYARERGFVVIETRRGS